MRATVSNATHGSGTVRTWAPSTGTSGKSRRLALRLARHARPTSATALVRTPTTRANTARCGQRRRADARRTSASTSPPITSSPPSRTTTSSSARWGATTCDVRGVWRARIVRARCLSSTTPSSSPPRTRTFSRTSPTTTARWSTAGRRRARAGTTRARSRMTAGPSATLPSTPGGSRQRTWASTSRATRASWWRRPSVANRKTGATTPTLRRQCVRVLSRP
mmetsp:Transcript_10066/g.20128  ORF Transcript_10066/g.20128 Transcript_10066/m.20128 type:complete len:222 (+) Transcript_10066:754-1419(+)